MLWIDLPSLLRVSPDSFGLVGLPRRGQIRKEATTSTPCRRFAACRVAVEFESDIASSPTDDWAKRRGRATRGGVALARAVLKSQNRPFWWVGDRRASWARPAPFLSL